MGWADGNGVFDPVAQALFAGDLAAEVRIRVLVKLIGGLQDSGWDTEDESLARFSDHPEVVEAFSLCGIKPGDGDE